MSLSETEMERYQGAEEEVKEEEEEEVKEVVVL